MSEIRISIDPTEHNRLPEAAHAAHAGTWSAERGYYGTAAAFMALAHALEIDQAMSDARSGVTFPEPLVSVPLIGSTRDEQPRTPVASVPDAIYGRARCAVCRRTIWAYGWHRDQIDVTRDPTQGGPGHREFMPGMFELTDWRHEEAPLFAGPDELPHEATPDHATIARGPLPGESIVGAGEH